MCAAEHLVFQHLDGILDVLIPGTIPKDLDVSPFSIGSKEPKPTFPFIPEEPRCHECNGRPLKGFEKPSRPAHGDILLFKGSMALRTADTRTLPDFQAASEQVRSDGLLRMKGELENN